MTRKCENCFHASVCGVLFPNNCPFYCEEPKQGEWIPCTEGSTKELVDVLVWYEYYSYSKERMVEEFGIGYIFQDTWMGDVCGERARCIAWMPLPEPYRKAGAT